MVIRILLETDIYREYVDMRLLLLLLLLAIIEITMIITLIRINKKIYNNKHKETMETKITIKTENWDKKEKNSKNR